MSGIVAFGGRTGGSSAELEPEPAPDPEPPPDPDLDAGPAAAAEADGVCVLAEALGGDALADPRACIIGNGGGGGTDGCSGGCGPRGAIPETLRPAIGTCGAIGAMGAVGVWGRLTGSFV